jgi:tetrapyrrole methylase family protein/MazG family protein
VHAHPRHERSAITIIGLGPGAFEQLSLGAWQALQDADTLYLRTTIHPTVPELSSRGLAFSSFDDLYRQAPSFEELYQTIADRIIAAAAAGPVAYAVPGHPLVAEDSVRLIIDKARQQRITVNVVSSTSALDAIFTATNLDPVDGLQVFDALAFEPTSWNPRPAAVFLQLYDRFSASQLKLQLLEVLRPDTAVTLVHAAGAPQQKVSRIPLHELDHQSIDHLTSLLVAPGADVPTARVLHSLAPLTSVLEKLLAPGGCPWDREQTHASLSRCLIEETYEVIDAIAEGDDEGLCEELGDVLLQVVFHAQLAAERDAFTIDDVVDTITAKMKRRHPHVFGDVQVADAEEVLTNWEAIKRAERGVDATGNLPEQGLLEGLPRELPALMLAEKLQRKAATVGFEWEDIDGAWQKLYEEIRELEEAVTCGDANGRILELGDVLFALVNIARYLDVDPEAALRKTADKFLRRFRFIEQSAAREGQTLQEMTLDQMDAYWDQAKESERSLDES